jgi:hypothetical protein
MWLYSYSKLNIIVEKFEHKTMQQMSTKMQQHQVEWRRTKVMELLSKGESNQSEISRIRIQDRSDSISPLKRR